MTDTKKPTITNAQEVLSVVHSLRERAKERNQDLRTLALAKVLHLFAEANGYDNWQQYSAALIKSECVDVLVSEHGLNLPNAEAAWNTLSTDRIRKADTGRELAEELGHTYASVPLPANKSALDNSLARLSKAMLEDCLDVFERLNNGENVDDIGAYGAKVSAVEICLILGSSSNLYLLVNSDGCVQKGRIETSGPGATDVLELDADQLMKIGDLFHIEIQDELSKIFG